MWQIWNASFECLKSFKWNVFKIELIKLTFKKVNNILNGLSISKKIISV